MAQSQPDPLDLFFRVISFKGNGLAVGQAMKLIEEAILADQRLGKIADILKELRAVEKSHSTHDLKCLHAEVGKYTENMNVGIAAGISGLLALMGDVEAERFAAWLCLYRWRHQPDISNSERSRLLTLGLGWMMQSIGACQISASRLGAEDVPDVVNILGYTMAAEIKALPLCTSTLEALVDHEVRDAPVNVGEARYETDGWREHWVNTVDHTCNMPEYVVGTWGHQIYTRGTESPLLAIGSTAARIRARVGSDFEPLCDAIIDDPSDFQRAWSLIDAMRNQSDLDLREEIEGLIAALAFAGDRSALLEAASYAVRRGYHGASKSLLTFALGALAIASGVREVTPVEPDENPVELSLERAGEYLVGKLMEQSPAAIKARVATDLSQFEQAEKAIGEERRADEEAEREAAAGTADNLIDDESGTTPSPLTKFGHLLDVASGTSKKSAPKSLKMAARLSTSRPETIRVIGSIGNADTVRDDLKTVMTKLGDFMRPKTLAEMPTDLSSWRQVLLAEFPHCSAAVDALHGDLLTRQMNGKRALAFRPTLLVGAPGCGKSRMARRVAESFRVGFRIFPCGGVADAHFAGVSRGWHSSHPSSPLDLIRQAGVPNPIIVLDEVEKAATSKHNGNLLDTLLSMLETETSRAWQDPFVQGPINISAINWLATANSLAGIPAPLLDRLRIVHVDQPGIEHLPQLSATILSELGTQHGHEGWHQPLDGIELSAIGRAWVRQPSIRYLRRLIEGALRAREQASAKH
jgi:hypothetical protein